MNKNKSILIPLFIIILLFSFNNRVEAANQKSYKIKYTTYGSDIITIANILCTSETGTCKFYSDANDTNPISGSADSFSIPDTFYKMEVTFNGKAKYDLAYKNLYKTPYCNPAKGVSMPLICSGKDFSESNNGEDGYCSYVIPLVDKNGNKTNKNKYLFFTGEGKNATDTLVGSDSNLPNIGQAEFDEHKRNNPKSMTIDTNIDFVFENKSKESAWDIVTIASGCNNKLPLCYDYDKDKKNTSYYIEKSDSSCSKYTGKIGDLEEGTSANNTNEQGTKSYIDHDPFEDFSLLGDLTEEDLKKQLSCEKLFENSEDLKNMIKLIINIIRIAVPIILIVFGVIDFGKAVFSSSEDTMKKAQGAFIKRIIIAVCILLVPTILKILLTIANQIWPSISADLCGIL